MTAQRIWKIITWFKKKLNNDFASIITEFANGLEPCPVAFYEGHLCPAVDSQRLMTIDWIAPGQRRRRQIIVCIYQRPNVFPQNANVKSERPYFRLDPTILIIYGIACYSVTYLLWRGLTTGEKWLKVNIMTSGTDMSDYISERCYLFALLLGDRYTLLLRVWSVWHVESST